MWYTWNQYNIIYQLYVNKKIVLNLQCGIVMRFKWEDVYKCANMSKYVSVSDFFTHLMGNSMKYSKWEDKVLYQEAYVSLGKYKQLWS